jgi:hypothetical protein
MKLEALFKSQIGHEKFNSLEPKAHKINNREDTSKRKKAYYKFEGEVFNFLFDNKALLGISKIFRFENLIIDGGLILNNDEAILLEFKYALGWEKSCQARLQFQRFQIDKSYKEIQFSEKIQFEKAKDALVIFHHFSGDWGETPKEARDNLNGWNRFYQEEEIFRRKKSPLRTHIMQYKKNNKARIYSSRNKGDKEREFFVKPV